MKSWPLVRRTRRQQAEHRAFRDDFVRDVLFMEDAVLASDAGPSFFGHLLRYTFYVIARHEYHGLEMHACRITPSLLLLPSHCTCLLACIPRVVDLHRFNFWSPMIVLSKMGLETSRYQPIPPLSSPAPARLRPAVEHLTVENPSEQMSHQRKPARRSSTASRREVSPRFCSHTTSQ